MFYIVDLCFLTILLTYIKQPILCLVEQFPNSMKNKMQI